MNRIYLVLLFAILIWSLPACKNDSQEQPAPEEEEIAPKPIFQVYFVNVDNLRVREAPNLESKVLDKIKEGSLVYSMNEYSERKETVTLRGKQTTAPYFFVNGNGFNEGWVYGGALVKIYQSTVPSPFTTRLQEIIDRLRNLSYTDFKSGSKLFEIIREFKGKDPMWNDAIYAIARHFFDLLPAYFSLNDDQKEAFSEEDYKNIYKGNYRMTASEFTSDLERNGYKLEASEGEVYALRDETSLAAIIPGPYSVVMQSHLNLTKNYESTKISEDGVMQIDFNKLVDMAIAEEDFCSTYPDFLYTDEHLKKKESLLYILTYGLGNSPVRSKETNALNPEFEKAWNYARQKYPDSDLVAQLNKINE